MLSISNLHVSIGDKPILKGLTLYVVTGDAHHIMGPNRASGADVWYACEDRS